MSLSQKNIIIAPLDWGLGHATRSMPIIDGLLEYNANVYLASSGEALAVLRATYPTLPFLELPAYHIQYRHKSLIKNSLHLSSRIIRTIPKEKKAIAHFAKAIQADIIISDNRFGCYTDFTKNIFITHQLNILTGGLSEIVANITNRQLLSPFDQIWVPDFPGEPSLAGKLSHSSSFPKATYIGGLTRFKPTQTTLKTIDVLAILSGPEPQRSYFETILTEQFQGSPLKTVLVRGKPKQTSSPSANIQVIDFADTQQLQHLIAASKMIISRPGYSSVMDYWALGLFQKLDTQLIFVPTPGQPEQIYLAEKFRKDGVAIKMDQSEFDLEKAVVAARQLTSTWHLGSAHLLAKALHSLQ